MTGLIGSMMSGMATGAGMSAAHRMVDSIMGPRQTEVVHRDEAAPAAAAAAVCRPQEDQLAQCMTAGDAATCQYYVDALNACKAAAVSQSGAKAR